MQCVVVWYVIKSIFIASGCMSVIWVQVYSKEVVLHAADKTVITTS